MALLLLSFLTLLPSCGAVMTKFAPLKEKMPWYKTGDEIHDAIAQLAQTGCNGANFKFSTRSQVNSAEAAGTEVSLDVVEISKAGGSGAPKTKAFFVFGEHARELITGESAVDFVQTLCGHGREAERAARVLETTDFTIIPNANPISRKKVESGMYCKRTNEDGVDLNRNWSDEHRDERDAVQGDEMNPGPHAYSEPETEIIKSLVDSERPDIYLSIHSGAYLLGTPYGRAASPVPENEQDMVDVLGPISEKYCEGNCPYGDLADLIGYKSIGCDIDYVKEKLNVPFVYTWEIYVGQNFRATYIEEAKQRRDEEMLLQKQNFLQASAVTRAKIKALDGERRPEMDEDEENCNDQFNPLTQQETQAVAENWTGAYLDLCLAVSAKRRAKSSAAASQPAASAPGASASSSADASTDTGASASTTPSPSLADPMDAMRAASDAMEDPLKAFVSTDKAAPVAPPAAPASPPAAPAASAAAAADPVDDMVTARESLENPPSEGSLNAARAALMRAGRASNVLAAKEATSRPEPSATSRVDFSDLLAMNRAMGRNTAWFDH